jgi:hypothetical protein
MSSLWECSECGGFVETAARPDRCFECGTAGTLFPTDADGTLSLDADDRFFHRAAWLRALREAGWHGAKPRRSTP